MTTLLMQVGNVPDGCTVMKRHGTYKYTLKRSVQLYDCPSEDGKVQFDAPSDGAFIVKEGNINYLSGDTQVFVELDEETAIDFIERGLT